MSESESQSLTLPHLLCSLFPTQDTFRAFLVRACGDIIAERVLADHDAAAVVLLEYGIAFWTTLLAKKPDDAVLITRTMMAESDRLACEAGARYGTTSAIVMPEIGPFGECVMMRGQIADYRGNRPADIGMPDPRVPFKTPHEVVKAWSYVTDHLLNEMSAEEPEGREALATVAAFIQHDSDNQATLHTRITLPEETFQIKSADAWMPMVSAAGLSREAYLEYGEYARVALTVHPDATITGRLLRRDGKAEVVPVTEAELAEESEDGEE